MTPKTWPEGLRGNDGEIRRDNFADNPASNMLTSPMEDGAKSRRKSTRGYSQFKGRWRFTLAEYEVFRNWVAVTLLDGNREWVFNHPLRPYSVVASFVEQDRRPFQTSPAPGSNIFVDFELRFLDRAV